MRRRAIREGDRLIDFFKHRVVIFVRLDRMRRVYGVIADIKNKFRGDVFSV